MKILKCSEKITLDTFKNKKKSPAGISKKLILCALKNNIAVYRIFSKKNLYIFKRGNKIIWLNKTMTSKTNPVGMAIARNKHTAKDFLSKLGYPVAPSKTISKLEELDSAIKSLGFPVVVKPIGAAEGKGITINVTTKKLLINSFRIAKKTDNKVIVEKHISGDYYRITYIADGSYAATKNLPAYVSGDGKRTVRELINWENKYNKERRKKARLKKIKISEKTERFLASEGYNLNSIIPKNKKIPLCFSGFDGGEYIDVTESVHPYFINMSKEISENLKLPIIGIDIISKDITKPLTENDGIVVEINGSFPDIQFHSSPTRGKSRDLHKNLINYLFS
ncbi:MAG TPA: ATP-grasp domain-containing protein [Candidatus Moranbacteria bacterium]|nr:ATP-grasp domain-containing protein [Candidatus Moranbacteria bacterium]